MTTHNSSHRYADSVTQAYLEAEPRRASITSYSIAVMIIFLICWAALADIDEFTRATGKVVPSQNIQVIQNLEGGIVDKIFAHEGQLVDKNEVIIRLDDTRFASSAGEANIEIGYLTEKMARLKAEAHGYEYIPTDPTYSKSQLTLFNNNLSALNKDKAILAERIAQRTIKHQDLLRQKSSLTQQLKLLVKELNLTKPLIAQGAVSEVEVLRLERTVEEMEQRIRSLHAESEGVQSEISELQASSTKLTADFQIESQSQYNDIAARIDMLNKSSQHFDDQLARTLIKSPVKGTIKVMNVSTIGGVVQPGMNIVEIVPFEDQLMVEVNVRPMDIAFIHPGQRASVRITAYDYSIHGDLKGKVVNISPDSIIDDNGESFYLVKILTDDASLQSSFKDLSIIPGMTVEAGILTGKKSILDYLLKPILKTANNAMRER